MAVRQIATSIFLLISSLCALGGEPDTISIERVSVVGRGGFGGFRVDSVAMSHAVGESMGDLLRVSTPVVIRDYGRGQNQSISFRGAAINHTSLYWNSLKINSPVVGNVDFSLLPAQGFDVLSVAPGVGGIGYGDGALGGVVDMRSRPRWDGLQMGFDIGAGSFNSYSASAVVRAGGERFESATRFFYDYSLNDYEFINRDVIDPANPSYRPTQRNLGADYQSMALTQDFFVKAGDSEYFSVSLMAADNWRNLPQLTTYEGLQNSNKTRSTDRSLRGVVNYRKSTGRVDWEAMIGGSVESATFFQENLVWDGGYEPYIDSWSRGGAVQSSVSGRYRFERWGSLQVAVSGSWQEAQSEERVDRTGFRSDRTEANITGQWHNKWSGVVSSSLLLRGGMVGDRWYGTGSTSVDFRVSSALSLSVRGGYNQHFASLQDMYYSPGGNPDLLPEQGATIEMGAIYGKYGVNGSVNLFYSAIKNWIIWLPTHAQYWTPQNIGEVVSYGAEAQLSYGHSFSSEWSLYVVGTATLSRTVAAGGGGFAEVGKQLPYVPLISGAAQAYVEWRTLSFGYKVEGQSVQYSATVADVNSLSTIEPYDIHSVSLEYRPWRWLGVELECENLYDGRFYGILRRAMPPRSFMLRVGYSFSEKKK